MAAIVGTVGATGLVVNSEAWAEFWEAMEAVEDEVAVPVDPRARLRQDSVTTVSPADLAQTAARLQYAQRMDAAAMLCRKALRSQLPEGWSASAITLGHSVGGEQFPSWQVSGEATISDAYGSRWRYDYLCDLEGSTVTGLRLTDVYGHENVLIAGGAR